MTAQSDNRPAGGLREDDDTRTCPFCEASIASDSVLCPQCDRFSKPTIVTKVRVDSRETVVGRINRALAAWETSNPRISETLQRLGNARVTVPPSLRLAIGAALITLAVAMCIAWLSPFGNSYSGRGAIAAALGGIAVLIGPSLMRTPNVVPPGARVPPDSRSVRFLGFDNSLVLAQAVALIAMGIWVLWLQLPTAALAAAVTVFIGLPLLKTRAKPSAATMIVMAVAYLLFFTTSGNHFYYKTLANNYEIFQPYYVIAAKSSAKAVLWLLAVFAIIPQLQLIAFNEVGVGRFKGDFRVRLFGTDVLIALTSAVLLVCGWIVLDALWNAPSWVVPLLYGQGLHA